MTFGEKLKEARQTIGLSQEQLAEKINISRSAVAKWENDIGMPDINNLKAMAKLLNVTVDFLLDTDMKVEVQNIQADNTVEMIESSDSEDKVVACPEYEGYYYSIELNGWNDGEVDVIILGEDKTFLYYKRVEKKESFYGMIGKKYITSVSRENKITNETDNNFIDKNYFCNKHVKLEIARREGFFKGFFDFRNDDFLDVVIKRFEDKKVILSFGREIDIDSITKIEVL